MIYCLPCPPPLYGAAHQPFRQLTQINSSSASSACSTFVVMNRTEHTEFTENNYSRLTFHCSRLTSHVSRLTTHEIFRTEHTEFTEKYYWFSRMVRLAILNLGLQLTNHFANYRKSSL